MLVHVILFCAEGKSYDTSQAKEDILYKDTFFFPPRLNYLNSTSGYEPVFLRS